MEMNSRVVFKRRCSAGCTSGSGAIVAGVAESSVLCNWETLYNYILWNFIFPLVVPFAKTQSVFASFWS